MYTVDNSAYKMNLIDVKFASGINNINFWFLLIIYTDVCSTVYSVLSKIL